MPGVWILVTSMLNNKTMVCCLDQKLLCIDYKKISLYNFEWVKVGSMYGHCEEWIPPPTASPADGEHLLKIPAYIHSLHITYTYHWDIFWIFFQFIIHKDFRRFVPLGSNPPFLRDHSILHNIQVPLNTNCNVITIHLVIFRWHR